MNVTQYRLLPLCIDLLNEDKRTLVSNRSCMNPMLPVNRKYLDTRLNWPGISRTETSAPMDRESFVLK